MGPELRDRRQDLLRVCRTRRRNRKGARRQGRVPGRRCRARGIGHRSNYGRVGIPCRKLMFMPKRSFDTVRKIGLNRENFMLGCGLTAATVMLGMAALAQ